MGQTLSLDDAIALRRDLGLSQDEANFDEELFEACERTILSSPIAGPGHAVAIVSVVAEGLDGGAEALEIDACHRLSAWLMGGASTPTLPRHSPPPAEMAQEMIESAFEDAVVGHRIPWSVVRQAALRAIAYVDEKTPAAPDAS